MTIPQTLRDFVFACKGTQCTVPGCIRFADTLDHRVPVSNGGPTSYENLYPMCFMHNTMKGALYYGEFLDRWREVLFMQQVIATVWP